MIEIAIFPSGKLRRADKKLKQSRGTPQAMEYQSLETVRQVDAIIKGEVPPGAVNADRWTRRLSSRG